jgi:hypothetical protein
MRALLLAAVLSAPPAFSAGLPALDCRFDRLCLPDAGCEAASEEFGLAPDGDAYRAAIDAGEVRLARISPPEAAVRSFIVSGPASVTVLLSIYPDGAFALTTQEDIDGPHVETSFGRCTPETR